MSNLINPNLENQEADSNLIQSLAYSEMIKHIPVGPNWFSEKSITDGEVSKFIRSLAVEIAALILAIKSSRNGSFISLATGVFLDRWGKDIGIFRITGETDDEFRSRIKKTLVLSRVTAPSIADIVKDNTRYDIDYTYDKYVKVIEPYVYQERRSKRDSSNSVQFFTSTSAPSNASIGLLDTTPSLVTGRIDDNVAEDSIKTPLYLYAAISWNTNTDTQGITKTSQLDDLNTVTKVLFEHTGVQSNQAPMSVTYALNSDHKASSYAVIYLGRVEKAFQYRVKVINNRDVSIFSLRNEIKFNGARSSSELTESSGLDARFENVDFFYGRSGKTRRTGSNRLLDYTSPDTPKYCYFNGGIIDVVTPGYSKLTIGIVENLIAVGIKSFFTVLIKYGVFNSDSSNEDLNQLPVNEVAQNRSTRIREQRDIRSEYLLSFGTSSVVTRSGPAKPVGLVQSQGFRADIAGLISRSGNKNTLISQKIDSDEPFTTFGQVVNPQLLKPTILFQDAYPAYRSSIRKELSARSGLEGATPLGVSLGWQADQLIAFTRTDTPSDNVMAINCEYLAKFNYISTKQIGRSFSIRSGAINTFTSYEFAFAAPVVSFEASPTYPPDFSKLFLLTYFEQIDASSPTVQPFVWPQHIGLSSQLSSYELTEVSESSFELHFESTVSRVTGVLGTQSENYFVLNYVLNLPWALLQDFTWEETLTIGKTKQFSAEVIVGP